MTLRSTPPFRADHVGSVLRPAALLEARTAAAEGRSTPEELRAAEDEAIRQAVRLQEEVGLLSATDGEFRNASWRMYFIYQLGGVRMADTSMHVHFENEQGSIDFAPPATEVNDRVRLDQPIFQDHFAFLQDVVASSGSSLTPKLTIPFPSMVHYRGGRAAISRDVYPDLEQFWEDLAAAYAEEVRVLAAQGCTYLQLDDTSLAYLNDSKQRELVRSQGDDGDHQHLRNIAEINAALKGRPEGLTVTTHMCRGNFRSSWAAEGGYDYVAEALFSELDVDGFFLESTTLAPAASSRCASSRKARSSCWDWSRPSVRRWSRRTTLKRRIDEAAKHVPLEQLPLSPQCGFSFTVEGNALTLSRTSGPSSGSSWRRPARSGASQAVGAGATAGGPAQQHRRGQPVTRRSRPAEHPTTTWAPSSARTTSRLGVQLAVTSRSSPTPNGPAEHST